MFLTDFVDGLWTDVTRRDRSSLGSLGGTSPTLMPSAPVPQGPSLFPSINILRTTATNPVLFGAGSNPSSPTFIPQAMVDTSTVADLFQAGGNSPSGFQLAIASWTAAINSGQASLPQLQAAVSASAAAGGFRSQADAMPPAPSLLLGGMSPLVLVAVAVLAYWLLRD